jgi:O-antigen/teichoic acid export membrane protein
MFIGPVAGILTAIERFDLHRVPVSLFRIVRLAVIALVLPRCDSKTGLIVFTAAMVGTNVLPAVVHRILVSRYTPNIRFDMRLARRDLIRPLIAFGIGSVSWNWAHMMLNYTPILLIGFFLTNTEVTEYDVPAKILLLVQLLAQDVMMVMMPAASRLSATGQRDELRELFVRSSKYAGGVAVAGCGFMAILSSQILMVWVREEFLHVSLVLSLLAVARACVSLQTSAQYVLIGMARQKIPATIALTTVVLMGIGQALCLALTDWGLVGVAAIALVGIVLGWGIAIPIYACRQVSVPFVAYLKTSLVRPVIACLPAAAVWFALRGMDIDHSWTALIVGAGAGVLLVGLGWWLVLFDKWDRDLMTEKLRVAIDRLRLR